MKDFHRTLHHLNRLFGNTKKQLMPEAECPLCPKKCKLSNLKCSAGKMFIETNG